MLLMVMTNVVSVNLICSHSRVQRRYLSTVLPQLTVFPLNVRRLSGRDYSYIREAIFLTFARVRRNRPQICLMIAELGSIVGLRLR